MWAWGQAISYVFTVGGSRAALGLTERAWRTLAVEMRAAGFLLQTKESIPGGGVPVHTLQLNFSIFQGGESSPQGVTSRARMREVTNPTPRASGQNRHLARGDAIDGQTRGLNQQKFKKQPPPEAGGSAAIRSAAGAAAAADRIGLARGARERFVDRAASASPVQLSALVAIVETRGGRGVRDADAFAIGLAAQAAAGTLEMPRGWAEGRDAAQRPGGLELLQGHGGRRLVGPSGPVAVVAEHGLALRIPGPGGLQLADAIALKLISKWQSGELEMQEA